MVPLLFSRDVYSYAFYGRIAAVHGENPYVHTPVEFAGDDLWPLIGPKWVDTPAVYGPAFTTISSAIARAVETPAGQVRAYRWMAALASLATIAVIAVTARRMRPERAAFAVAAFGLNPVIVFHGVASGHNDLLVALAVAAGFLLLVHDRTLAAVAVLAVGTLIKATVGLPLVLVLVWCVARTPAGRRARAAATHVGLAVAIGLLFAAPVPADPRPHARHARARRARGLARAVGLRAQGLRMAELRHARLARPRRVRPGARGDVRAAGSRRGPPRRRSRAARGPRRRDGVVARDADAARAGAASLVRRRGRCRSCGCCRGRRARPCWRRARRSPSPSGRPSHCATPMRST